MTLRIDPLKTSPEHLTGLFALQKQVDSGSLEPVLSHLVRMRASQLNGCAFCLDMHSREAREAGETDQRLYVLDAWAEAPLYSAREQAALAWTEAVTHLHPGHVSDEVYSQARAHFDEHELIELTVAIAAINCWNRLCIAFRVLPGSYERGARPVAGTAS